MKTEKIAAALRCCASDVDCAGNCPLFGTSSPDEDCSQKKNRAAADRLEELVDRCARYAEEIAVLQKDGSDLCRVVGECGGLDRIKELAKADKDGRIAILPCKVGDMVYRVFAPDGRKPMIQETQVKTLGQAADLVGRIGKPSKFVSVFLTREEAEKALEARTHGTD